METADLTDLLKEKGSYTIFAPTDDAFEGLSKEDFALLKSEFSNQKTDIHFLSCISLLKIMQLQSS